MSGPQLTALIRCRDEVRGIGPLIDALRSQTIGESIEIVVLDSGSVDGTLEEVRRRGIEPLHVPPGEFTYGRALNLAASAASSPICVSISAHVRLLDDAWAGRVLQAFDDGRVACAYGPTREPRGLRLLTERVLQDEALAEVQPLWGYSNSSGAFRRELWRQRPFDERLRADEDLEWAWYWQRRGWLVLLDPALAVHHSHADEGPVRIFRRRRAEAEAVHHFRRLERPTLGQVLSEWWFGPHLHRSNLRARLDPRRAAALAGKYIGMRWPRPA